MGTFERLIHLVKCQNTNCNLQIIGDVHQLIGHCFIPLDPGFYPAADETTTDIPYVNNNRASQLFEQSQPTGK